MPGCQQTADFGSGRTPAILLAMCKELQHMLGGEIAHGQPIHRLVQLSTDEWQKKAEGVAVALAGVPGQIAFGDDVLDQEAPEPWAKGYEFRHPDLRPHSERSEEMPAAEAPASSTDRPSGLPDRNGRARWRVRIATVAHPHPDDTRQSGCEPRSCDGNSANGISGIIPVTGLFLHCMQITLTRRLHALVPGLTARSALEKFAAVQMIDVHLPTTDGREIRLTRYTHPEPELQLLIDQLKLRLPPQPPPRITPAELNQVSRRSE
jgi:hypothetical protein